MTARAVAAATAVDTETPRLLAAFTTADPGLLQERALLSRVDRKYLLPRRRLDVLLQSLQNDYHLLPAAGHQVAAYRTIYFDTADRRMFHDHRRGRLPRTKVRIRHHLDRQVSFLEVKRKDHGARTSKARMSHVFGDEQLDMTLETPLAAPLDTTAARFVDAHCPYPGRDLSACISNEFHRLTLLGERVNERITIDWDLAFGDLSRVIRLPDVVIVEIKQGRYSDVTPAPLALRSLRIREGAVSKYCLATARLGAVRLNLFKPALRAVEQLST